MAVRTDEFFALAKTEAMGWDMPGLPLVVVPHPLAKRSPDECGQFAAGVLGEIADALTANAQTVKTKYRAKTLEAGDRRRYRSLFESEFNAPDAPLRIKGPDAIEALNRLILPARLDRWPARSATHAATLRSHAGRARPRRTGRGR